MGTSLAVLWLGLCVFSAGAQVQSLREAKTPQASPCIQKKKKKAAKKVWTWRQKAELTFLAWRMWVS